MQPEYEVQIDLAHVKGIQAPKTHPFSDKNGQGLESENSPYLAKYSFNVLYIKFKIIRELPALQQEEQPEQRPSTGFTLRGR